MNNIQKAFKTKSKLRGMADGGQAPRPEMLGSGMAQRAVSALQGRRAQLDAAIDAASGAPPPRPAPTVPVAAAPAKKPEEKSALRSFFGLADGGSPADVDRIMNSRDMSIFTPKERKTFNAMGQAAMADAAQMQAVGLKAGQQATDMGLSAATQPQFATPADDMAPPETELADGGKVKGKGGPTDDKVGPVMLSDGEYVLPADTVEIVGRENLDALRLATHDFVDERNKPKISGLRKMADGGTFYVDPDGVARRGQMPPGRALVPYQPPGTPSTAVAAPRAPIEGTATSSLRSAAGRGLAGLGGIYAVSDGVRSMANEGVTATNVGDTASGLTLLAQAAGRAHPVAAAAGTGWAIGRAIGNNLNLSTDTQDAIGSTINNIVRGTGQITNKGLRTIGFDTDFGSDWGVDDSHYLKSKASAGGAPAAPQSRPGELPGMSNVPADVRTSSAGMPATPVQPQSYQSRRLAEMGVPVDQQNLAPVTEDTRRSLLREGVGTPGQYVNLGSYGGDANIYGTASKPGGRIDTFTGVGASARPDGGPQEDPIMGEIRSALRGLTGGTDNGGGGGGGASIDSGNAREINERYDKLASQLRSMYGPKGQGNLARRLLELEQSRSGALDADARNQSALRGQDINASTAANNASLQARMQALQILGSMANQRSQQGAQAQAAMLKAKTDAAKDAEARSKDAMASMNDAIDRYSAGDKDRAATLARVASNLQADLRAAIDALPASDRPGTWASVFDAYTGQTKGLVAGRNVGAAVQNTLLGAGTGAVMPGIGRAVGLVGDLAGTALTRGQYRGSVLRNLLGSRLGSAALGAGVGAIATPEVQVSGRLNLPVVSEDGLPIPADATFVDGFKHGFFDTNKPWAKLHRGENGELQVSDYSDDELAAIRDLSILRRFGKE